MSRSRPPVVSTIVLVVFAIGAALTPLPASAVERVFSRGLYPSIQSALTAVSNLVPLALLDIAAVFLALALAFNFLRRGRARGWMHSARHSGLDIVRVCAIVYLLFLGFWGLNYRRVPLEQKLDFDRARVTPDGAFELASEAIRRVNALHAEAHLRPFDPQPLYAPFASAQRALAMEGTTRPGRAKRSLLGAYFRKAGIDGMTDPVFLEVIVNPDLLDVEKPEVLAHEWAHLAGFADESEANFLAWLTCLRGDSLAQYSGWLSTYRRAAAVLPRDRRSALPKLAEGPRDDLKAIATRLKRASPTITRAAQGVYDSYLKANGIAEGIANYDAVLQLMLGTTVGSDWTPH